MLPDYLYHYTSIPTLALILHTKQIRLNRIDKLDDLQESKSSDLGNHGRFYFVSCWSSPDIESIPFWTMYTPKMAGVRIRLPADMFKKYTIQPQSDGFIHVPNEIESFLPYERIVSDQYTVIPTIFKLESFLKQVEYTNDEAKIFPNVMRKGIHGITYSSEEFGKYKRLEWQFQNEWRFIIKILPAPLNNKSLPQSQRLEHFERQLKSGLISGSLPFDYFDMDLEPLIINSIEVVLGPRCTKGDEVVVDSLLSKYCTNSQLRHSNLKGLIR